MPKYRFAIHAVLSEDRLISKLALMTDYDEDVVRRELESLVSEGQKTI